MSRLDFPRHKIFECFESYSTDSLWGILSHLLMWCRFWSRQYLVLVYQVRDIGRSAWTALVQVDFTLLVRIPAFNPIRTTDDGILGLDLTKTEILIPKRGFSFSSSSRKLVFSAGTVWIWQQKLVASQEVALSLWCWVVGFQSLFLPWRNFNRESRVSILMYIPSMGIMGGEWRSRWFFVHRTLVKRQETVLATTGALELS